MLVSYAWDESGEWSTCPNDCGQQEGDNKQTRDVPCKGTDGSSGTDQCSGTQPDTEQNCPATASCGIFCIRRFKYLKYVRFGFFVVKRMGLTANFEKHRNKCPKCGILLTKVYKILTLKRL